MKNLTFSQIDKIEEILLHKLGIENLFFNLSLALSYETKQDNYLFIARMHDIDLTEVIDNGNNL